jgi:hypothetical protein
LEAIVDVQEVATGGSSLCDGHQVVGQEVGNCSKKKMWSDLENIIMFSNKIIFSGFVTYFLFLTTQMRARITVTILHYLSHSEQIIT